RPICLRDHRRRAREHSSLGERLRSSRSRGAGPCRGVFRLRQRVKPPPAADRAVAVSQPTGLVAAASSFALRGALQEALSAHFGAPRSIVRLEREPSAYGSTFALEELRVDLDDGTRLHLMFKDLSWRALLESTRGAKPRFLYNPLREIQTYRAILANR